MPGALSGLSRKALTIALENRDYRPDYAEMPNFGAFTKLAMSCCRILSAMQKTHRQSSAGKRQRSGQIRYLFEQLSIILIQLFQQTPLFRHPAATHQAQPLQKTLLHGGSFGAVIAAYIEIDHLIYGKPVF